MRALPHRAPSDWAHAWLSASACSAFQYIHRDAEHRGTDQTSTPSQFHVLPHLPAFVLPPKPPSPLATTTSPTTGTRLPRNLAWPLTYSVTLSPQGRNAIFPVNVASSSPNAITRTRACLSPDP